MPEAETVPGFETVGWRIEPREDDAAEILILRKR
jgi:hypothetical protein